MVELGKEEANGRIDGLTSVPHESSTSGLSNRVLLMRRRLVTLALLVSSVAVVYASASCASPAAASPAAAPTRPPPPPRPCPSAPLRASWMPPNRLLRL